MIYGSVCSGIEAATVAWRALGWKPAFFSEIEKFPRAVLAYHYPSVPCHGDFTTIGGDEYGAIDVLVGGTPCQDFSIAGLRGGIAGERGNLTLEFLRLAARKRPRWLVWENVPGVLSSDGGRALGAFLGGLGELGYGSAYRVLDAQFFNLAQRRARVFVVGYLGDWRRAAAVLFERASLSGHPAPSREAGKGIAPTISARTKGGGGLGTDFDCDGGLIEWPARIAPTLNAHFGAKQGLEDQHIAGGGGCSYPRLSHCLNAGGMGRLDYETETLIPTRGGSFDAHAFDARQSDVAQYGERARPLDTCGFSQAICFGTTQITHPENRSNPQPGSPSPSPSPSPSLSSKAHAPAIAFTVKDHGGDASADLSPTLRSGAHSKSHADGGVMPAVVAHTAVRRLTPLECCRLQGFPDDYLDITYRGKPAADGPKYKALGNSMAVPVMAWLGRRIALIDQVAGESRG